MPKKKTPTEQERYEKAKSQSLQFLQGEYYYSHPTAHAYAFRPGDAVIHGSHEKSIIREALYNGQVYIVENHDTNRNGTDDIKINAVFWHQIRPIKNRVTDFTRNTDIRLYYSNCTIESIIHRYYAFGVNMDPPYQRDLVWDQTDRELLLDSIFCGAEIGRFVFRNIDVYTSADAPLYEIIDGKQRLNTLISYYENQWAYHNAYFDDLSNKDRRSFLNHNTSYADVKEADDKNILRIFLMLNKGGRPMDPEHLKKIETLYQNA